MFKSRIQAGRLYSSCTYPQFFPSCFSAFARSHPKPDVIRTEQLTDCNEIQRSLIFFKLFGNQVKNRLFFATLDNANIQYNIKVNTFLVPAAFLLFFLCPHAPVPHTITLKRLKTGTQKTSGDPTSMQTCTKALVQL